MCEQLDEFRDRCWKLLRSQGDALPSAQDLIYFETDRITIEVCYNAIGTEFFDVMIPDVLTSRRRVYRERSGERSHDVISDVQTELLTYLRNLMILEDLADV